MVVIYSKRRQLKIAFIESASSGYLSQSVFYLPRTGGAEVLLGGLVSYDPSIKIDILHIDAELIEKYTAESAEVTEAMARRRKKSVYSSRDYCGLHGLHSNLAVAQHKVNLKAHFSPQFYI